MKDKHRHRSLTLVLLASAAMLPELAAAAAGKLLFVAGPVTRERQGAISAAQLGDALESGDVVATGAKARAQILMGDGARFALRAGTRFKVDEFRLPSNVQKPGVAQAVEDSGRSVTSLIQGGFRTRSGTVGKSDRSAYEVRTPVGTLGIRGTEYVAVFCRNDCSDAPGLAPGQPIRAGLYLLVSEGRIVFTGRGITLTLDAPNAAFIPLEEAGPEELRDVPAFLREDGFGVLKLVGRVSGAGDAQNAIGSDPVTLLSDRRAPQDSKNHFVADAPLVKSDRPVDANSPFGTAVDLTSGARPSDPQRDIAMSVAPAAFLANADRKSTRLNSSHG